MSVTPPAAGPLAPYCTGPELAAHLGGAVDAQVAESCAYAASTAIYQVVVDPGWDNSTVLVPEGVHRVALMVGAEIYRAGSAPGGEYQLDAYATTPATVTSRLLMKYGAMLSMWRGGAGMVG